MKKIKNITAILLFFIPIIISAQTTDNFKEVEFTRGSGFVVRPELNNGLLATFGYQINPHIQLTGSIGFGLLGQAGLITVMGIRAYTSDKPWAAFFDYRAGIESASGTTITRHTIVAGVSYKDFDFGAGAALGSDGYNSFTTLS